VLRKSYEFQGESYRSVVDLESALNAQPTLTIAIWLSSCADQASATEVVRLVGKRQANVALSTFAEECQ
jgi:hypothetical protein